MSSSPPAPVKPPQSVQPLNPADLAAVAKRAASDGLVVGVRGAGTKLAQGNPPTALQLMIDTTRMNRIARKMQQPACAL